MPGPFSSEDVSPTHGLLVVALICLGVLVLVLGASVAVGLVY